jgi:hypothetical protein
MDHWENTVYEGHVASDYNARYFSNWSAARNEANLLFLEGVDLAGVLAGLRHHDLIHGPDNQVKYLTIMNEGGWVGVRKLYKFRCWHLWNLDIKPQCQMPFRQAIS